MTTSLWRQAAAAMLLAALASGCFSLSMRPASAIPAADLYPHRGDLPALVVAELEAGRTARAFYALEVYKTRGYAAPRLAAQDPQLAATQQALHRDLRPLFASLFTSPSDDQPVDDQQAPDQQVATRGLRIVVDETETTSSSALRQARAAAEAAFWDHLRVVDARFNASIPYDMVLRESFAPTTSTEAALMFDRRELFVSYLVKGEAVYAFVVGSRGKLEATKLTTGATELRQMVQALRRELDAPPASGREQAWQAPAKQLYERLVAPLAVPAKLDALYISPSGFLANVPFSALVAGERPLVETTRVTYLPSASVYRHLLQREVLDKAPRFLSIGNPTYPPAVPRLPFAEEEAETLSYVFDEASLYADSAATERAVTDALSQHNILHFATHGVLLGQHAPGASSLMMASDERHDGFLSAAEIAALDLSHTYLAVLSACETSVAAEQGDGGDLASITSAFMIAGTPSVIGSLWKVADTSTTRLMLEFYREFLGRGAGDSLRRAQLALRSRSEYRHPYYWAPFVLYGWDR